MNDSSRHWNFHHVGFVVTTLEESAPDFAKILSASWTGDIFLDPLQRVRVTFLQVAVGQAMIELVEPIGAGSPVQRFLSTKGGGLHHLCYEVNDIKYELKRARLCGGVIVSRPKPAVAFGGRRIAWVLSSSGLLVELLERSGSEDLGCSVPVAAVSVIHA